jgi:hypothetical protein
MKHNMIFIGLTGLLLFALPGCSDSTNTTATVVAKTEAKHHLHIPEEGIESMMEENTQKIIEGTDGSVVIQIGEITRKQADLTVRKEEKILLEKLVKESDTISFTYEGASYKIEIGNIKKPLLGTGKVFLRIQ